MLEITESTIFFYKKHQEGTEREHKKTELSLLFEVLSGLKKNFSVQKRKHYSTVFNILEFESSQL